MVRRTKLRSAVLAAMIAGLGLLSPAPAEAVPVRSTAAWSVLLCKLSNREAEPKIPQFFREFLTQDGAGLGGLADYFADQSYGRISLVGSVVRGWYTMSYTFEEEKAKDRGTRIQDCVNTAAANGYTVPAGHRIIVITNDGVDSGTADGRVLLDPGAWNVGFAAHEMLHGYGLGHSFSDDVTYKNVNWSQPGEYDDRWDEMSAMNIYPFSTTRYGTSAVSLNGYLRDKLGWLPISRVLTVGRDGVGSRTLSMAPLEVPATSGPQLVRIPFDPADIFHYYTVEFRKKTGWSAGIPGDIVLIHEVRNGTPYLLRTRGGSRDPIQSLNANGVTIGINWISSTSASVNITTDITQRCVQGYVWREARSSDKVCVTGAVRQQTWADNAVASSRWISNPFGPHTCVQGYIWREAFPGDDVCTVPANWDQARNDNAAAASRANPARFVNGPNSCKSGYVWREADDADYTCVSGATRDQAKADNAVASSRWISNPFGPHTCVEGYVWREAFPGDDVCTVPANWNQARNDNAAAASRLEKP